MRLANARLQPRQRLVLALRELEDRSYAEIGQLVGMKENAVAQLIFRARESLRLELRLAQVDPDRLPEDCRRYLPLLAAHLDGQLKGARQQETLAHLDGCERCQDALASMREASKRYRTLYLPGFLETDEARAAVEKRLDAAHYWDRRGGRLFAGRTKQTAAAIAAVVALSGGGTALGVALSRDGDPPQSAVQPTTEAVQPSTEETVTATTEPPPVTVARKKSPPAKPATTNSGQDDRTRDDDDCAGDNHRRDGTHDDSDRCAEAEAQAETETHADRDGASRGHEGAHGDDHAGSGRVGFVQRGARSDSPRTRRVPSSPASSTVRPTPRARAPWCSPVSPRATTRSRCVRRTGRETLGSPQAPPGVTSRRIRPPRR